MVANDDTIDSVGDTVSDSFDDPLSDSMQEPLQPSRASIKSFWLGCVGLSTLSLIGTLLVGTLVAKYEFSFLETSLWTAASWQFLAAWHFSVYTCLMPCMVVGSVLRSSIHLWRLLAVSLAVGLLFSIIAEVKYYEYANAWFVLVDPSTPTLPFALICGFVASVSFAINLALCAWWLRFCGWHIDQTAEGESQT